MRRHSSDDLGSDKAEVSKVVAVKLAIDSNDPVPIGNFRSHVSITSITFVVHYVLLTVLVLKKDGSCEIIITV